ncbi:AbrB/MazE/SpoVT family DNA-binding domain-containing protein [Methyloceanibacter sp.]|uniref:AbrB/MazE/SpoVT family DNA-binding domain-containing protein n=1 Tax=Methyloceanibacter sp. TaxID=1965321 RepID=UPI003D6DA229
MKVKIAKWGNSLAVRLPKALAEEAGLTAGKTLDLRVEGPRLVIETGNEPKIPYYRLEDLLAQIKPGTEPPPMVDWGSDVGAEILPEDEYSRGEITPENIHEKHAARRRRHRLG